MTAVYLPYPPHERTGCAPGSGDRLGVCAERESVGAGAAAAVNLDLRDSESDSLLCCLPPEPLCTGFRAPCIGRDGWSCGRRDGRCGR